MRCPMGSKSRQVVRVFLASPSDLCSERSIARDVASEENGMWAADQGFHIEVVGWEDMSPGFGRPQELINKDVESCDLFVGLLWKRWGTPPSEKHTSGFEEELDVATALRKRTNRYPDIAIFFKQVEPSAMDDPGDELRKVLAFREKVKSERQFLFKDFKDENDFRIAFRRCVYDFVARRRSESVTADDPKEPDVTPTPQKQTFVLSQEVRGFLSTFVAEVEGDQNGALSPATVARLRAIGVGLHARGNSVASLEVHDANILYAQRKELNLSSLERLVLLEAGLVNFHHENVPVAFWRESLKEDFSTDLTLDLAFVHLNDAVQVGAISALTSFGQKIRTTRHLSRSHVLRVWLSESTPEKITLAALRYLREQGLQSDLKALEKLVSSKRTVILQDASLAILSIIARFDRSRTAERAISLPLMSLSRDLSEVVHESISSVTTEGLYQGITHPCTQIRKVCIETLFQRKAINLDVADGLLRNVDVFMRLCGMKVLLDSGKSFSALEVKGLLLKSRSGGGLLASLLINQNPGYEQRRAFDDFCRYQMSKIKDDELSHLAVAEPEKADELYFERATRGLGDSLQTLRWDIADDFQRYFAVKLARFEKRYGHNDQRVITLRDESVNHRRALVEKAVTVLCEIGEPDDLESVRAWAHQNASQISRPIIKFLSAHGDATDVPCLIQRLDAKRLPFDPLYSDLDQEDEVIVKTIVKLSIGRLAWLLELVPEHQLAKVLMRAHEADIKRLSDATLERLLGSKVEQVRKCACLQVIMSLEKQRITRLLEKHQATDSVYYNVFYWLDIGSSLRSSEAKAIARRALGFLLES